MTDEPTGPRLRIGGEIVAGYVVAPEIDPRWGPRPYLHPVRTLAGVTVTDTLPEDHRWHLGVSVALQDVSGTNLWGGRTYVRDTGYTWRDDHGQITHDAWLPDGGTAGPVGVEARVGASAEARVGASAKGGVETRVGAAAADTGGEPVPTVPEHPDRPPADVDGFAERLRWSDPSGATLLTEERTVRATALPDRADAWLLDFAYRLTAPADRDVVLGSPATNGRPGGAGYGGFFWRAASGEVSTFTASADGEEAVNGSTEAWLALGGRSADGAAYTLVFTGLGDGDHWFVRTGIYPGVCVALAWQRTRRLAAGTSLRRRHRIVVADGNLLREGIAAVLPT
ncbi:PmoA family protein [Plantactinospora sp. B5E13]|uniref:DUF6807 domain-containing protein n=1 Tax=Plantactinospora sp. B5E13 TaxID=3153758 RepID=UPI00325CC7EA